MKFAILNHLSENAHYDIMLERGNTLFTLKIEEKDIAALSKNRTVSALRIDNHRKKYLNYEGPISCNRGTVKIYDKGLFNLIRWNDDLIEIELYGNRLRGKLSVKKITETLYKLNLLNSEL